MADLGNNIDPKTMTLSEDIPLLNALNVKYLLVQVKDGQSVPIINPFINGNAWFVNDIKFANSPDEEMKDLNTFDSKKTAIVNKEWTNLGLSNTIKKDSLASIELIDYKPNYIKYTSNNTNEGVAVFSEVYYPKGWKATIDGKEIAIFRADYVLRALQIPAGKHLIEFKFEPEVIKTGSTISLFSSIGMVFLIIGGLYFERKKKWYGLN